MTSMPTLCLARCTWRANNGQRPARYLSKVCVSIKTLLSCVSTLRLSWWQWETIDALRNYWMKPKKLTLTWSLFRRLVKHSNKSACRNVLPGKRSGTVDNSEMERNSSAGVPRVLQAPLAGCGVSPPSSPTLLPEAVQEKKDLNSYQRSTVGQSSNYASVAYCLVSCCLVCRAPSWNAHECS